MMTFVGIPLWMPSVRNSVQEMTAGSLGGTFRDTMVCSANTTSAPMVDIVLFFRFGYEIHSAIVGIEIEEDAAW